MTGQTPPSGGPPPLPPRRAPHSPLPGAAQAPASTIPDHGGPAQPGTHVPQQPAAAPHAAPQYATAPSPAPHMQEIEDVSRSAKPARDIGLGAAIGLTAGALLAGGGIVWAFMSNSGGKQAETAPAPTVTAPAPVPVEPPAPPPAKCDEPRAFTAGEQRVANFLNVGAKIQFCENAEQQPNNVGEGTVLRFNGKSVSDFTTAPRTDFQDFLVALGTEYAEANGSKPCDKPDSVYNLQGKRGTDSSMCIEERAHALADYFQYFMTANRNTKGKTREVVYQGNAAKLKDPFGQPAIRLDRIGREELKIDEERQAIKKGDKSPIHSGPRN